MCTNLKSPPLREGPNEAVLHGDLWLFYTGLYSPVQSLLALIQSEPGTLVKIITITFKIIIS